ncbi:MAG: DUF1552 domain-containing protein [Saccharospirillaceae bacterium]|nr:DUF1552 domain-containing protein [Pseudomonadales bacterium]NRB80721.1 DUF1552 domain-containing protein [Saccharospirillaceae bacterium]
MKKLQTKKQAQRRTFLKTSAGVASMSASSLGLGLLSTNAIAANNSNIKRVVFVYVPYGAYPGSHLFKNGTLAEGCEPLITHQNNIIFFEDCDTKALNYKTTGLLGLQSGGKTLDVVLGETFGVDCIIPTLHLGIETHNTSISYNDNSAIIAQNNPVQAFENLQTLTGDNPQQYTNLTAPLELHLQELEKIKQLVSNNTNQVKRLEQFEHSIQTQINQAQKLPGALCSNLVQDTYNWDGELIGNFTIICNMHCDTIASAFECELTKVATLQLSCPDTSLSAVTSELNNQNFYETTHYGREQYYDYSRYTNERIAYLIDKLKNTYDKNGDALFESTLIFKVTDFGNADAHNNQNAAFMMAAGSAIFDGARNIKANNNYDLLDTITKALGLEYTITPYGTTTVDNLFK